MTSPPSVHAVIRSCGERTAGLCRRLVERELPPGSSLTEISAVPFEATLRQCWEDAIARAAEWTLTIDADVLLAPAAVATLLQRARAMPPHFLQLEARAFDKVQGRWREVGHRVYRTELLPKALALLPAPGTSIRPESATIKRLGAAGHPSRLVDDAVGVHDFDQYCRDLYRKAFTHAHKHRSKAGAIIARCADLRRDDPDYYIILKGVWDGLLHDGPVRLDASAFAERAQSALAEIGIAEKQPLEDASRAALSTADAQFRHAVTESEPPVDAPRDEPPQEFGPLQQVIRGYRYRLRKRGILRGNLGEIGALLTALGARLDRG